jgi:hypothetical protein
LSSELPGGIKYLPDWMDDLYEIVMEADNVLNLLIISFFGAK